MHPASRILVYLLAALAIPGLPFLVLTILLGAAISALLALRRSPLALFWRTRWLLLVIVLGYAYGLPGESLLPALGNHSPSLEGVLHGCRQAVALVTLLCWLDVLVLAQPAERLLGGLYQLARPFSVLGMDAARLALRLGLTLKAIEGLERGRGNLVRLLDREDVSGLPARVRIETHPAGKLDVVVPLAFLAAALGVWLSA